MLVAWGVVWMRQRGSLSSVVWGMGVEVEDPDRLTFAVLTGADQHPYVHVKMCGIGT